jgi:hypothetical protein
VERPAAPSALAASAQSDTSIRLTWQDNSTTETTFHVERKSAAAGWAEVATTGPNTTAHTDTGLSPSTLYTYRVRASNAGGFSTYSPEAGATTSAFPSTITVTSPNGGETWSVGQKQLVTWTSHQAGPMVRVDLSTDNGASWQPVIESTLNDGADSFTLLCPPSKQARLRVQSVALPACEDVSNTAFTVQDVSGGQLRLPGQVKFGTVPVNTQVPRALVVRNTSRTGPLRVTLYDPEPPFAIQGGTVTLVIPAKGSQSLTLSFQPPAKGKRRDVVQVTSSDPRKKSARVTLTGAGK